MPVLICDSGDFATYLSVRYICNMFTSITFLGYRKSLWYQSNKVLKIRFTVTSIPNILRPLYRGE